MQGEAEAEGAARALRARRAIGRRVMGGVLPCGSRKLSARLPVRGLALEKLERGGGGVIASVSGPNEFIVHAVKVPVDQVATRKTRSRRTKLFPR